MQQTQCNRTVEYNEMPASDLSGSRAGYVLYYVLQLCSVI